MVRKLVIHLNHYLRDGVRFRIKRFGIYLSIRRGGYEFMKSIKVSKNHYKGGE